MSSVTDVIHGTGIYCMPTEKRGERKDSKERCDGTTFGIRNLGEEKGGSHASIPPGGYDANADIGKEGDGASIASGST